MHLGGSIGFYSGNVQELLDDVVVGNRATSQPAGGRAGRQAGVGTAAGGCTPALLAALLPISLRPPPPTHTHTHAQTHTHATPPPQSLRPNVFVGVPRIWNRIYDKVTQAVREGSPLSRALFERVRRLRLGEAPAVGRGACLRLRFSRFLCI